MTGGWMFLTPWQSVWLVAPLLLWGAVRLYQHLARRRPTPPDQAPEWQVLHPATVLLQHMVKHLGSQRPEAPRHSSHRWRKAGWCLAWSLLVLAMMQPEWLHSRRRITGLGVDIVLAVDLSRSMLALDMSKDWRNAKERVTRLDVVRNVLHRFIQNRVEEQPGDRYGLVYFADHAYVQSPLTADGLSIAQMLATMQVGMAGEATAIGDAVALGVKLLKERDAKSRVLVLLTDGANNAGMIQPLDAARLAKEYDVHFYAISVGASHQVPFPEQTPQGLRIIQATMEVDDAALSAMAKTASGQFFQARDPEGLRKIYDYINQVEVSPAESYVMQTGEPLYRWPLGLGLFLVFCLLASRVRELRHA
jgi:Ca-activated chloride channel family protein